MSYDYQSLFGKNAESIESLLGINNATLQSILAIIGSFLLIIFFICLAILIIMIIAACKLYKKAGKDGWEAIIPFYNDWVYVEIAGLNWWWFLLLIASTIVSIIFGNNLGGLNTITNLCVIFSFFVCNYNISKKLHKNTGFAVLMTIFPVIMIPLIAFSKSYQFDHNVPVSKNGIF